MCFCTQCGAQLPDNAVFCSKCGNAVSGEQANHQANQQYYQQPYQQQYYQQPYPGYYPKPESGLTTAAKVFMVIGTVVMGCAILPLAWCLPMTITYFNKIKYNQPVSTGFKVCSLLFVSMLGGIFMLCDNDH